ncbi:MAG: hypothetical protein WBQ94_24090 [Terracidiphilus sp.]
MIRKRVKKSWIVEGVLVAGIFVSCCTASAAADSITGVVRNQTYGRPAGGDDVILLGIGPEAHVEARTKTDSQGAFILELHQPGKPHLVRVIHQGVNYDRRVSGADVISIDIADAAANVRSISGGIEIIRIGTQGSLLHVSDMVEIKNDSSPPMTEANERTFEIYLPVHAKIDSVLAAGPENIGVPIAPIPAHDAPGRYTVNFPLRPGSTKFAFNYDLPYDGRAVFRTKNMYPLQQLAVMIPPTIIFASRSPAFQILPVGNDRYRVEAAESVKAGEGPEFEISGVGDLPSTQDQVHSVPRAHAGSFNAPSISAQGNANPQAQSAKALESASIARLPTLSSRMQWGIASASAVVILAACMIFVWRRQRRLATAVTTAGQRAEQPERANVALVEALKDGLFQLETDRLRGAIPEEEYVSAKQALERTIQWALTRSSAQRENVLQQLGRDVSHPSTA